MLLYNKLKKKLLVNHIVGSLLAILGVGSVFIFHILHFSQNEIFTLLFIMLISLVIMYCLEFIVYKHDIYPIKAALTELNPSLELLKQAYTTAHRLPVLTVRRIMLPHLLGISIPASALTIYCIHTGKLGFPCYYIGFAWCGVILISTLHAIIEYFLTERILHPLILHFNQTAKKLYHKSFEIGKFEFISIRRKLLLSSAFIAVFPVLLFTLAATIQLIQKASEHLNDYWSWSVIILIVIVSLSAFCSVLLYENIKKPIYALEQNILQVRRGKMHPIENTYSDEFAYVISGFNNMIQGMKKRDSQNQLLLESFFTVFAATLDARDPYTAGHSIRVAEYPVIGAHILEQINLPKELKPLLPGVKYHHERYDGNGYPEGLSGENIPLFGRIMAVADAYDAMTSDRPYRKGMPSEKALNIIHSGKGTQWDPYYAGLFVQIMREN